MSKAFKRPTFAEGEEQSEAFCTLKCLQLFDKIDTCFLTSELERNKQYEKLQLFRRFLYCLIFTLFSALILSFVQSASFTWDITKQWTTLWILEDLVPYTLFLCIIIFMMYLWRPNRTSHRLAYFSELQEIDDGISYGDWSDKLSLDDDSDDELFLPEGKKSMSKSGIELSATVIGRTVTGAAPQEMIPLPPVNL
ncbi:hypothetical protein IE077_004316 [Cardiosporidium cionae]|uniref:GOST seven transmembrane domain-containing protein n=1 Tax=Cardiosporidium cionae TaxID=476202 RepID=A0ABQ7JD70_9APIC|nr:hypothetical protein IE077_004316 [Cardiosporidium cionae]|eukprot:KAF8821575.1 hypothetical protein IE077_004316 [Cardiosporidium cionae]